MTTKKETSVAFTGYRMFKILPKKAEVGLLNAISQRTYEAIEKLYNEGCTYFYTGCSDGFDLLGATNVLKFRESHPDVKLIAVVPFKGQAAKYSESDKQIYQMVLEDANETIYLAERFIENAQYLRRNDYMLDHASHVICYYDGKQGGTMYTYNRAIKRGYNIINICK